MNTRLASTVFGSLVLASIVACSATSQEGVGAGQELSATPTFTHGVMKKTTAGESRIGASATAATLVYQGGKVIPNVKAYNVNWGPNVTAIVKSNRAGFYTDITNSAYYDWLSEYNTAGKKGADGQPGSEQKIGRGTFGGSFTITPTSTSTSITDDDIKAQLAASLDAGTLPAPDENSIYMFDFPPGVVISLGTDTSCTVFCAYHGTITYKGKSVPYGVLPDMSTGSGCENGCGTGTPLDNYSSVASHELVEATTDMEVGLATALGRPLAWYDSSQGEIGDICNGQQDKVGNWTVQKQWSNAKGACISH